MEWLYMKSSVLNSHLADWKFPNQGFFLFFAFKVKPLLKGQQLQILKEFDQSLLQNQEKWPWKVLDDNSHCSLVSIKESRVPGKVGKVEKASKNWFA